MKVMTADREITIFGKARHFLLQQATSSGAEQYVPPLPFITCDTTDIIEASRHPQVLQNPSKPHQNRKRGQEAGHPSPR